jgi:hypothetical protein
MATPIGASRHWEIKFDKDGALLAHDGLVDAMSGDGPDDLFVFSHGWNTPRTARASSAPPCSS